MTRLEELDANLKLLVQSQNKKISTIADKYNCKETDKNKHNSEKVIICLKEDLKEIEHQLEELSVNLPNENSNIYWSLLSNSILFNRLIQTKKAKLFVDLKNHTKEESELHINLPKQFQRNHHNNLENCITIKAEDLPNRENYSYPIIHGHKYAYYRNYDGKDKIVKNLKEEEKKHIIANEISKNKADAQNIFLYTQKKRAFRKMKGNHTDYYFSNNETEQDIYDVTQRQNGPRCCFSSDDPLITTIGHATLLIQYPKEGITILTDPVYHHMQTVLYPRKTQPAWKENQMPLIDVIIISHNHRDHVDEPSLKSFVSHQPLVLVPLGDAPLMYSLGFKNVIEHNTWQRTCIKAGCESDDSIVSFISVPANHWSCRGINDANKSLFVGWIISTSTRNGSIYFAGDTAVLSTKDNEDIFMNPNFPPVELNLVPGGPNHRRDTMENTHASAANGIYSHFFHLNLRARNSHPCIEPFTHTDDFEENIKHLLDEEFSTTMFMHHNTFELGIDRFNEAEYVRNELIQALSGNEEKIPKFVLSVASEIKEIAEQYKDNISLSDIINKVVNPKIGQVCPL